MTTLSETEARDLLSRPLVCREHDGWEPDQDLPNAYRLSNGLVLSNGDRARLVLEIIVKISPQTSIKHFTFSIYQPRPYNARVYQLEVRDCPKALKDKHQWPHEHFGSERETRLDWKDWDFQTAFDYFKAQTNLTFEPQLSNPFEFELTP